jgi:TnpA family transposase
VSCAEVGALFSLGTARSVSEVSLMMPGVTQTAIGDAMTTLERGNVLRAASDAVVELMFRQSITQQWGRGTTAIKRIAVDTHGYTDFAMGLARLLGFDLCPRLKSLSDRMLYVPKGFVIPDNIESIVRPNLNLSLIEAQWDELVRLAASVKSGKVTATTVLKRFGSVATGDPLYRAGKALGRLERSLFLCDVGSLTLLTNIVMTRNTLNLQSFFKQSLQGRSDYKVEHLSQVAPIHHRHINFNGHFTFPVEENEDRLFASTSASIR